MNRTYTLLKPYLRRHRGAYTLGLTCVVASLALRLWIPKVLGDGLNALQESDATGLSGRILELSAFIVGAALLGAVTRNASRVAVLGSCRHIAHELRGVIFARLVRLAPSFYVRNPTGQIMSRCINDLQNVQGLLGPVILYLVETSVLYVLGIAMMLTLSPLLTTVALVPFPFLLVASRRIAVRIQEGSRAAQNALGEVSAKVDESLSGQMVIKTLTLEEFDLGRFRERCEEYRRLNLQVTKQRARLVPLMTGLPALSMLLLVVLGGPRVARGELAIGDFIALLFYLRMFIGPTRTLGFVISSLRRGASALERIREILDSEVSLDDPAEPLEVPRSDGPCSVEVRGLTITYAPLAEQPHLSGSLPEELGGGVQRERSVLQDVSFEVPAGATLGIVGHTGSGKTTLVRALARLLEVPAGTVFVDGVDVTRLRLHDLRTRVGFVPQDVFLFSATLAENIALGRPDATREQIEAAAEAAQLATDLAQLPQGLDTLVGERGVRLSGGQRQRTALARVLLTDPSLLILDDTLSAVDTHTADRILEVLRPFASRRTTILASHRLSTLAHADSILVLDEGRIAERGTHAELLALGGIYADLWRRQEERARSRSEAERLRRELETGGEVSR